MYRLSVLRVPDERLDFISKAIQPKKTTPATVEVAEYPGLFGQRVESRALAKLREADALALVVRAFDSASVPHFRGDVDPKRDLDFLVSELQLADLAIVESRLERIESSLKKRKNEEEEQQKEILQRSKMLLDEGRPLRQLQLDPNEDKLVRGFGFLTQKPLIVLVNLGDSQLEQQEEILQPLRKSIPEVRALCGDIEAELARLEEEERAEFMEDFGIDELAAPVFLSAAYRILDVATFYTYGEEECRAWTIRQGDTAVDAAGKVHTDLARGFIRAEVVSFEDFRTHGSIKEVKAAGRFRLEGRDYVVQDGDLIIIRHSG